MSYELDGVTPISRTTQSNRSWCERLQQKMVAEIQATTTAAGDGVSLARFKPPPARPFRARLLTSATLQEFFAEH